MKLPVEITECIDGLLYSTNTAVLLAHDDIPGGNGLLGEGAYQYLYRTKTRHYFLVNFFEKRSELNMLEAVTQEDHAKVIYRSLPIRQVPFREAFPSLK